MFPIVSWDDDPLERARRVGTYLIQEKVRGGAPQFVL